MKRREINYINSTPKKIIDVAIDLFATRGFKGTSIREIAKISGLTITNIYYYFGSKEGLLLEILEQLTRQIVEKLRQVAEGNYPPLERFKLLLETHLELLLNIFRKESKILFLDEEHVTRINKQFQIDILNIYRKELQNLQSLGYTNYKNITILAFNILGVLNWHLRWYRPEGRMTFRQISDEMLAFILYGTFGFPKYENQKTSKS